MADEPPQTPDTTSHSRFATAHGVIVEAVRKLSDAGIDVEDLALRRPTLDDVFLALTGHAASEDEEDDDGEERAA